MKRILVINGPNLETLGRREPEVYGAQTLTDLNSMIVAFGIKLGVQVTTFQSNHEGELIEAIRGAEVDGLVINPAALTHTSIALADSIRASGLPCVEVHLSNIFERGQWRSISHTAEACVAQFYGRGLGGYRAAVRHLINRSAVSFDTVRYGPHHDNVGDLRIGNQELIILIHGGVWRHPFERDTIESLAVDLNQRGYTTWNLEHRRIGKGGGWPASGHDVLTALDFIPQLGLAPTRVTVLGHSAGGYLGLWASPRSDAVVDRVVGLAPIVDLEHGVQDAGELAPESRLFLDAGAPSQVDPGSVDTVLVHGEADQVVPFAHSLELAKHRGFELFRASGHHYDLLDPSKEHWEWVLARLAST